jgi:rhodanese-related sulfurtransferase/DNA-binding transcriptional ArsR family regulator
VKSSDDFESDVWVYDELSRISKALASPRRLHLIHLLAQAERTVEELAMLSTMSVANTSRHLQALLAARLVAVRRAGLYAHYRLADTKVFALWQAVRDLGESRLARMRELVRVRFTGHGVPEPVDLEGFETRRRSGEGMVVDVRPEHEFEAGHIPGAVSLPLDDLEPRLHVLPADQEILVCGRGPYCALAHTAAATLMGHGYRARRLLIGYPDWQAAESRKSRPALVDSPGTRS